MSYIDLLFPSGELEALGNKWPEPATKRRKLDHNAGVVRNQQQQQRQRQPTGPLLDHRRHTVSTPSQQSSRTLSRPVPGAVKRSNSESNQPGRAPTTATSIKATTTAKSCLPSFIEPSLLKNYLHHLHPNDRSRYSIPNSPEPEPQPTRSSQLHHEREDSVCSPASLTTDTSSSTDTADNCPTPSTGIYEQLTARPFGYLMDGLRLTEHERDLMDDLLSPNQVPAQPAGAEKAPNSTKRKAAVPDAVLDATDFYNIGESLLHRIFPAEAKYMSDYGSFNNGGYKDTDVHSSGLSPAAQEEEDEPETTAPSTLGFAITVDDFFDLDEASGLTGLSTD